MKTILLTRNIEENNKLRKRLKSRNFASVNVPLIKYQQADFDFTQVQDYNNVIITSKYAAKILAHEKNLSENIEVIVTGSESASILERAGFTVKYIAENVRELGNYLKTAKIALSLRSPPDACIQKAIYLSSNEITEELPLYITRKIIYQVEYLNYLTRAQIRKINNGIDYIFLYSQNCARTLVQLMHKYDLIHLLERSVVIAISVKVAEIVRPYFNKVIHSKKSSQEQMIELLISHENNQDNKN